MLLASVLLDSSCSLDYGLWIIVGFWTAGLLLDSGLLDYCCILDSVVLLDSVLLHYCWIMDYGSLLDYYTHVRVPHGLLSLIPESPALARELKVFNLPEGLARERGCGGEGVTGGWGVSAVSSLRALHFRGSLFTPFREDAPEPLFATPGHPKVSIVGIRGSKMVSKSLQKRSQKQS